MFSEQELKKCTATLVTKFFDLSHVMSDPPSIIFLEDHTHDCGSINGHDNDITSYHECKCGFGWRES